MKRRMPFPLSKEKSFYDSLNDWIGDTLYDDLTEKGFECRDEQIFMAFQIEKALKEKKVLFAEAGVGTGKTIAYLASGHCLCALYRKTCAYIMCGRNAHRTAS